MILCRGPSQETSVRSLLWMKSLGLCWDVSMSGSLKSVTRDNWWQRWVVNLSGIRAEGAWGVCQECSGIVVILPAGLNTSETRNTGGCTLNFNNNNNNSNTMMSAALLSLFSALLPLLLISLLLLFSLYFRSNFRLVLSLLPLTFTTFYFSLLLFNLTSAYFLLFIKSIFPLLFLSYSMSSISTLYFSIFAVLYPFFSFFPISPDSSCPPLCLFHIPLRHSLVNSLLFSPFFLFIFSHLSPLQFFFYVISISPLDFPFPDVGSN